MTELQFIKVEKEAPIAVVSLNRPKALNALNMGLMDELVNTLQALDVDSAIRAIVLTGNEKAFAAGADIAEMAGADSTTMLQRDQFAKWDKIRKLKKPIIAAVSGFALGGGCELMMHCDIVIASETAQFGQPEIKIGVMPGAGGTQRLTRAIGKVRAMELVLTGKFISASEALSFGLINRVVPIESYLSDAKKLAHEIAGMSPIAVQLAKESINKSYEMFLMDSLEYERKNFYLLFSTQDQKEGMNAFLEKRIPNFTGK